MMLQLTKDCKRWIRMDGQVKYQQAPYEIGIKKLSDDWGNEHSVLRMEYDKQAAREIFWGFVNRDEWMGFTNYETAMWATIAKTEHSIYQAQLALFQAIKKRLTNGSPLDKRVVAGNVQAIDRMQGIATANELDVRFIDWFDIAEDWETQRLEWQENQAVL